VSTNALLAILAVCFTACFIALVWASTKHRRNDTKER
jgi:preprotein translocase subunit SecG